MPKDSRTIPRPRPVQGPDLEGVRFIAKAEVPSLFGTFTVYGFLEQATAKEHLAIVSGDLDARTSIAVRIHSECLTGEVFGSLKCDCRSQLEAALRHIAQHGGIVLYLRQEGRGIGLLNKLRAYALQERGYDTVEANHLLGFPDDLRSYAPAIQMLRFFGIRKTRLLTNNPRKIQALEEAGLEVVRVVHQQASNPHSLGYLKTKALKSGHLLSFQGEAI